MTTRRVDVCGIGVQVTGPAAALARMADYIGHLPAPEPYRAGLEVRLDVDPALVAHHHRMSRGRSPDATVLSHPELTYRARSDSGRRILLPEHGPPHVIIGENARLRVIADTDAVVATVAVRVIRQVIMRGAEHAQGGCLHAGAVALAGRAVLVGGRAGAGKTAVLTTLVDRHTAAPIANDRAAMMPTRDAGGWIAAGVPLAWRVTLEGVNASPRLRAAFDAEELSRGTVPVDDKIEFTPGEIAACLGVPFAPAAPVERIVVLVRAEDRQPTSPDLPAFLREHLGFGDHDPFAEDWLHLARILRRAEPPRPGISGDDMWTRLASSLPVAVLSWTQPRQLPAIAVTIAKGTPQ